MHILQLFCNLILGLFLSTVVLIRSAVMSYRPIVLYKAVCLNLNKPTIQVNVLQSVPGSRYILVHTSKDI